MQLDETQAFVAVVEAGSFTGAGKRLGIPKSTLSRQVSRLEERLGARLMQRTTRKLSLTDLGEAYFERCQPAIATIADAERVAQELSGRPQGTLKVSTSFDVARDFLPSILPGFRAAYPEVAIELVLSQGRVDLVAEGFDVAIRGGALPDAGFVARKLIDGGLALFATPAYLERRGRPEEAADLANHDMITIRPPTPGSWRLMGPDGPVVLPMEPWLQANEFGILHQMVRRDLGIGLLLEPTVAEDVEAGRLERVLPDLALGGGGMYAIYPSRRHLSPKVRVFVDHLVEHFSER